MPSGAEHVTTVLSPWTTVTGLPGDSDRVRGGGGAVYMRREGGREGERERNYITHVGVCVHAYYIYYTCGKDVVEIPLFQIRKLCLPGIQPHPQ